MEKNHVKTAISLENFLYAIGGSNWQSLPEGSELRYMNSILNYNKKEVKATLEALSAYLAYRTLKDYNPKLARYFASHSVEFWPLMLLDEEEIKETIATLPPYPLILDRMLRKYGFYESFSSYLRDLGVEATEEEIFSLVLGANEQLFDRIKKAYETKYGKFAKLFSGMLAGRALKNRLEAIRYRSLDNLQISGDIHLMNWIAFLRAYIPLIGLESLIYSGGNIPASLHSIAMGVATYLLIYGPLVGLSYKLKMKGELKKSKLIDTLRTMVWILRSPLWALETMIELKYGGNILEKAIGKGEEKTSIFYYLSEAITNGNIPLGPYVLSFANPPGERPFIRKKASEEEIREKFIQALETIKGQNIFPPELVEDTKKEVERGIIPVRKLRTKVIGESGRTKLINQKELYEELKGLGENEEDVIGSIKIAEERGAFPLIISEEGELKPFWYRISITDNYSGDYLYSICLKEAFALLFFRMYEMLLKKQKEIENSISKENRIK